MTASNSRSDHNYLDKLVGEYNNTYHCIGKKIMVKNLFMVIILL